MTPPDDQLLERYAAAEAEIEAGPYRRYREVLGGSLLAVGAGYGVRPGAAEVAAFGGSVGEWPSFPDFPRGAGAPEDSLRAGGPHELR